METGVSALAVAVAVAARAATLALVVAVAVVVVVVSAVAGLRRWVVNPRQGATLSSSKMGEESPV
jgi:hypothetical protein